METIQFTNLEKDVISNLEKGLRDLENKSNLETSRLGYTEKINMIKIQKAKILFFKRGIQFRERQRKAQTELSENEHYTIV